MEIIGVLVIAAVLVAVARGLQHDASEYGPGCAGLLGVVFVAVVFVTIAAFLATHGGLP